MLLTQNRSLFDRTFACPDRRVATVSSRGAGRRRVPFALCLTLMLVTSGGCTPTVKVATDEPITINLNVNIKHEILIKVDKDLDTLFSDSSDLF